MAVSQLVRLSHTNVPILLGKNKFIQSARFMSAGERGSGAGLGGGSGGSIRDAGGSMGRREAANEEKYFREKDAEMKKTLKESGPGTKGTVGFVGIGNMGSLMAKHLLENGHKVRVYDLNKSAIDQLVRCGADSVKHVAELADSCDRVFTMLPTPDVVLETYKGKDGLLSRGKLSTIFIDSSTVDPATAINVYKAAKLKGLKFFDAPVAGAVPAARTASLVFMVGGDALDIKELLEPYLMCMGTSIYHCGPIGSGCVAKLCNNMMLGISMLGLSEALLMGKNFGLDPKLVTAIINKGSGKCWSSEINNPAPGVLPNTPSSNGYEGGFKVNLLYKDLGLAYKVAQQVSSPNPLGALTHQFYRLLMSSEEYKFKDFSVIYKYLDNKK